MCFGANSLRKWGLFRLSGVMWWLRWVRFEGRYWGWKWAGGHGGGLVSSLQGNCMLNVGSLQLGGEKLVGSRSRFVIT